GKWEFRTGDDAAWAAESTASFGSFNQAVPVDRVGQIAQSSGPVPAAENYFLNRYQTAGVISAVDAVAGASQGTGPALRAMLTLLDAFLEDLNGGN
ncbi:MAG TPA: hypothetical protein P5154_03150, partial [Candidatus Izemoplasmatales bacterium]|nr:hypothetical protein [Candidatus Izemoplasmatales bacterium]